MARRKVKPQVPARRVSRALATHHLVEFMDCDPRAINSARFMTDALARLCRDAPLHAVKKAQHKFAPHGLTVLILLRESHLAFHSWPEHAYAALDLFLCGPVPGLQNALAALGRALGARAAVRAKVPRGPVGAPRKPRRARSK